MLAVSSKLTQEAGLPECITFMVLLMKYESYLAQMPCLETHFSPERHEVPSFVAVGSFCWWNYHGCGLQTSENALPCLFSNVLLQSTSLQALMAASVLSPAPPLSHPELVFSKTVFSFLHCLVIWFAGGGSWPGAMLGIIKFTFMHLRFLQSECELTGIFHKRTPTYPRVLSSRMLSSNTSPHPRQAMMLIAPESLLEVQSAFFI